MKSAGAVTDVFDEIRRRCAEVTRRAEFVRIEPVALEALASALAAEAGPEEDFDPAHHFSGDPETTLAFTLLLDAINFGSGWFPVLTKRDGLSGYRTIASACRTHFEAAGAPSPAALREMSAEAMAEMLGQDRTHPEVAELMGLFAEAWRDFGDWLGRRHDDRYASVVESVEGSAARLVMSLAEMPLYRDIATYDELEVPFFKRAQITAADLCRVFGGESYGRFEDLPALTLFADNLVPHVLRCRGVLAYAPALSSRIEGGELLEVGAPEEVEIRAVAVEAVERLVSAMRGHGRDVDARTLDGILWNAGQAPEIKARPRHRARSTYY